MIRLPNIKSKAKFIILAVLSILTAVLLSVNIRQVTVSGNSQYTGNEIVELIFQKNMQSVKKCNISHFFYRQACKIDCD